MTMKHMGTSDASRAIITHSLLFAALMLSSCHCEGKRGPEGEPMLFRDEYVNSPKSNHPNAKEWVEGQCQGLKFMFCQETQPGYGVSIIDFHGWRYDPARAAWEHFIYVRSAGIGSGRIHLDETGASCSLRGEANNRFLGKDVVVIDLAASVR